MIRKLLFGVIIVLGIVTIVGSFVGCDKKNIPTGPTTPTETILHDQPPNEDGYEPLGVRHYLTDATGNPTKMWVELIEIRPLRGSRIITGPFSSQPDCNLVCYAAHFRYGVDEPIISGPAAFFIGFSETENSAPPTFEEAFLQGRFNVFCGGNLRVTPGNPGECKVAPGPMEGGGTLFTTFSYVPQYLYSVGVYGVRVPGGTSAIKISGKTKWPTGYQKK